MKTLFLLFASILIQTQSGLSQGITPVKNADTSLHVMPYMFPKILADLTKGWNAENENVKLKQEVETLKKQVVSINRVSEGQALKYQQATSERDSLIDRSAEGWGQAKYWKGRYKKASTERWIWRSFGLGFGIFKAKQALNP